MSKKGAERMETEKTINIAVGCVMASHLEMKEKREVIDSLRQIEEKIERYAKALKDVADMKNVGFPAIYIVNRYSEYAESVLNEEINNE